MAINNALLLADNISQRVELLLSERAMLLQDYHSKSIGSLEHDKAFISSFQKAVIDGAAASCVIAKLEHLLLLR